LRNDGTGTDVVKVGVFYLPSVGTTEEVQRGMAGNSDEAYQRMLSDLGQQAVLADDLGYDSIAFTEHHFHIEGFELSNNPVLLDLFVGLQTKRIRVGQLGIVLPASSPLRVAEDIAMLDHMTGGRAFAGFARGYQRRWVDTLAQPYRDIHATSSDQGEVDALNREAFEEFFRIIKLAWTRDTFSYEGKFWRIPPVDVPWDMEATRTMGTGVDASGRLVEIGVVPKPVQKPHPPLMQPFAFSESTIRWCAREEVMPVLAPVNAVLENELFEVYAEEANASGRSVELGDDMGVLRDVVVADTDEEAFALWANSGAFVGGAWFSPFGFSDAIPEPGESRDDVTPQLLFDRSLVLVGSVDTVTRQLARLLERLPLKYLLAWQYVSLIPNDELKRSLELFATKVLPRVT
jgi:alkanesulfonate monooxygenase SsuD/methylene tetrahydromethanopterin reductase-like flavin-dependent oxidoreductase (luciferase family)